VTTRMVSVEREIPASATAIFAVLVTPSLHQVIDGSGSVKGIHGDAPQLTLGSKFGMEMKMGLPYRVRNTVVEYEQDRLIAWRHFAGHRWRYELTPVAGETAPVTRVRETFDYSRISWLAAQVIELLGFPEKNLAAMSKTLESLEKYLATERS
jgi:hypothetical protein